MSPCLHVGKHTCLRAYIPRSLHTCSPALLHACALRYLHTCTPTHLRQCPHHTRLHAYMPTRLYVSIPTPGQSTPAHLRTSIPPCRHAHTWYTRLHCYKPPYLHASTLRCLHAHAWAYTTSHLHTYVRGGAHVRVRRWRVRLPS
jgi:hypothetical protein